MSRPSPFSACMLLLLTTASVLDLACSKTERPASADAQQTLAASGNSGTVPAVQAEPGDRNDALLDLAFSAASAMPTTPHQRNRARAQNAIVEAAFKIGRPERALAFAERIDGWEKGLGLGEFAAQKARRKEEAPALEYLRRAQDFADGLSRGAKAQNWQVDRIRAKAAVTLLALGHKAEADRIRGSLLTSEAREYDLERAALVDAESIDGTLQAVDAVIAAGDLDAVVNALAACTRLFDRFYADLPRRTEIETRIRSGYEKLPTDIRVGFLLDISSFAAGRSDREKARELAQAAAAITESTKLTEEFLAPIEARLAQCLHQAGDDEGAARAMSSALNAYDRGRALIADIHRARVLRPIAESLAAMGRMTDALGLYARAVDEGAVNPNARPRAEDLAATCCSMARAGLAPDAVLWEKMQKIRAGLVDPW